jgi:hypothetical protein
MEVFSIVFLNEGCHIVKAGAVGKKMHAYETRLSV